MCSKCEVSNCKCVRCPHDWNWCNFCQHFSKNKNKAFGES